MEEHFQEEIKDHYPASGLIEFQYGSSLDFRSDTYMVKPTLGKMLVFPAWLKHSVRPNLSQEERSLVTKQIFLKYSSHEGLSI